MQKYNIEILPPAWSELDEIASYYHHVFGVKSAQNITAKIFSCRERLEQYPLSCPYVPDKELGLQEYRCRAEYVCFYRLIGNTVYIYHIVHDSREYAKLFK
jgi:plasmid stabilization system protein ParE